MKKLTITEAAAGPLGEDVRSDAHVRYLAGAAPLEVAVASKVDYLYGDAIAAAARRVAEAFAVTSGRLEVTDQGALEWVLLARIEACLRRAGFPGGPVLPERAPGAEAPRQRERLRRSRLYIPGNRPKLMLSAGLYSADGLILDLEDSVPPAEKDAARLLVRNALVALDFGASERTVRVNQGELGLLDLEAIAPHNVHMVLLPKVEGPERVTEVAAWLRSLTGATDVLLVTEPTLSGAHDLERVLALTRHFGIPAAVCVNKWDINPEMTGRIEAQARQSGARVVGRVRYDPSVTRAQIQEKAVVDTDCPSADDIRSIWKELAVQ